MFILKLLCVIIGKIATKYIYYISKYCVGRIGMQFCCLECLKKKYPFIIEREITYTKEKEICKLCGNKKYIVIAYGKETNLKLRIR